MDRCRGAMILLLITTGLVSSVPLLAQEGATCPGQVQAAFRTVAENCGEIGPGEVCYGNPTVIVQPQPNVRLAFASPGDSVPLMAVESLSTSTEDASWGVIRLHPQAYTMDDWQPLNITMLVFGDVMIENSGGEGVDFATLDLEIGVEEGANVRVQPSTEFRLVQQLLLGERVKVTGRLADNSWLRVQLPHRIAAGSDPTGWISRFVFQASAAELEALPIVEPGDTAPETLYRPMAAFSFQSGIDDAFCTVVPDSGILIQTPRNEAPALLQVNHVALELSGTIFLQAQPERVFIVNVLEGDVQLALLGNTQTARAGTQVMIPLDDTLMPLEEPGEPQRYDYDRLTVLPLSLLPRITTVAVSLDDVLLPPPPDGSDPLASLGPESVCTVAAISAVNLRNGPGLRFPVIGEMMAGQSAHPDGLWSIPGTAPWWRLTPGVWVSWQAVFFEGNCNSVSRIEFTAAPAG